MDISPLANLIYLNFSKSFLAVIITYICHSFFHLLHTYLYLFIYFGFYVAFNTVQVISRRVVGRAEETSTFSSSGFCTVNCRPTASNYQLSHLRLCREPNPDLRGGRRGCYHSATVAPHTHIYKFRAKIFFFCQKIRQNT